MNGTTNLAQRGSVVLNSGASHQTVQLVVFALAYLAFALVEQSISVMGGLVPIALSQGLAIGFLVRAARPARWAALAIVFVFGATVTSFFLPPLLACGLALLTAVTTLLGAWLIRSLGHRGLPSWEGLVALIGIAALVAALNALGTFGLIAALPVSGIELSAQIVWVATFSGVLLATPAVIMLRRSRVPVTTGRIVELSCLVAITLVTLILVFDPSSNASGIRYLLIPLGLWSAIRFGLAITAIFTSVVSFTLLAATHLGLGPYIDYTTMAQSVLQLQLALTFVVLAIYAVAINEEQRRSSDLQLFAAHGLVESLLTNSDAMISIVTYDRVGQARYTLANKRFARTLGLEVSQVIGRRQDDLALDPSDAARQGFEDQAVIESGRSQVFVTRARSLVEDDSQISRVLLVTKFPVATADERQAAVGSVAIDITEHRRRERLMRSTFDESPVPMVRLAWHNGRPGVILDANRSAAELLDVSVSSLIGQQLDQFTHPTERSVDLVPAQGVAGQPRRRDAHLVRGNGEDIWVTVTATVVEAAADSESADGIDEEDQFALVVFEDISARKAAEQTLTHQALHDALTGVLNRYALIDRLEAALNRLWRENNYIAVLFCDLDGFKNLNDTLGHRAGDQMLISVSERLRAVMRPQDTVARLGGDEFVLVCEGLPGPGQARVIGERIRESMRAPFQVDGRDYGVTVSVGIATTTDASTRAEDLLRRADLAMYRAKDNGRNRVEYYAEELEARAVAHVEATETLRRAIENGHVVVHYQPIIDSAASKIVGVEALARLQAADGSLISPGTFISVAESSGLVMPMGEQVLDQALDQLHEWTSSGIDVQMNVNVSPRQLARASFAPNVFERLMERGLAPQSLCLEITEGAVVDATGPTLITLRRLRSYGVHVGIDDFGTGYSSLTTLKYLPADVLKVDKSFVEGLGSDANDSAIVAAVIKVAHDLGCVVVAEGVESARQVLALRDMGCDQIQGYRYGRPVSAAEMTQLLRKGSVVPTEIDLTDSSDLIT